MTLTATQTIQVSKNVEYIKDKLGVTSLFGKKPIEEEAMVLREVHKLLEEPYLRVITPLPISKEDEEMIKERVREAVRKLSEIL